MTRLFYALICVAVLLCSHSAAIAAEFMAKGEQVFMVQGDKHLLLKGERAEPVKNSDMKYVCFNEQSKVGEMSLPQGTYIFDKSGKQIKSITVENDKGFSPSEVGSASMSPDGKILALDNGTSSIRVWFFLDYASAKVLSGADMVLSDSIVWVDNERVLFNYVTGPSSKRTDCGSEFCENIINVALFNIKTEKQKIIFPEDELCNVNVERYADGVVHALQECKTEKDWQWYGKTEETKFTERKLSKKL